MLVRSGGGCSAAHGGLWTKPMLTVGRGPDTGDAGAADVPDAAQCLWLVSDAGDAVRR